MVKIFVNNFVAKILELILIFVVVQGNLKNFKLFPPYIETNHACKVSEKGSTVLGSKGSDLSFEVLLVDGFSSVNGVLDKVSIFSHASL